jgi:segregation and condensation protein A
VIDSVQPDTGDYRAPVSEETAPQLVADDTAGTGGTGGFHVDLGDLFEGPFDLLLGLIAKHKLDVTEVALARVTDEFIAHIKTFKGEWGNDWLGETTEFLVVAATLLDLKAARLLPSGEVEDEEDLALLEARDLLFARLLQYRAYKQVAAVFAGRMAAEAGRYPRAVSLEPQLAGLLPEVLLGLGPAEFALLAGRVFTPRPIPTISFDHLHAPVVSVREQAAVLVTSLRRSRTATFRSLVADCEGTVHVVARFLALLELYREGAVSFEQVDPLGELHVRWIGTDEGDIDVPDEFDDDTPALAAVDTTDDAGVPDGSDDGAPAEDGTTIDLRESGTDD